MQPTAEYHGSAPAPAESGHVRVALVRGSAPVAGDDLHRLLRRRLLIVCTIAAGATAAALAVDAAVRALSTQPEDHVTPAGWFLLNLWLMAPLVTCAGAAAALWRRPPRSERGLRAVELAVVGVFAAALLWVGFNPGIWGTLQAASGEPFPLKNATWGFYANNGALLWFFLITLYGAFIPNTWRRCAAVVAGLGASPIALLAVVGLWLRPVDPEWVRQLVLYWGFWIGLAGVMAVFSTSRLEVLRRRADEARKLGQYVLRDRLGAGGMGEVYRAEHVLLRRPCALKTIRPDRAGDPDTLRRFEREVQITATLTHPNTVQVFDYGHADDGTFYYVMEYLPGLTLEEIVRRHGPLPPGRAVHFLRQVCAALGEAHARGLTHRDIKPGNVMVCERGGAYDVAKLLDFGLVRAPTDDPDGGALTRDGAVAGTPAYMPPEQAGGRGEVDPRSDLYGVGAVAYFLLTGEPPFAGRSAVQMLAAHLYELPAPLPAAVPAGLAEVVRRCLQKSPAERFPSAASLESALAEVPVPAWTAGDARDWWVRAGGPARPTAPAETTVTRAEPGAAPAGRGI